MRWKYALSAFLAALLVIVISVTVFNKMQEYNGMNLTHASSQMQNITKQISYSISAFADSNLLSLESVSNFTDTSASPSQIQRLGEVAKSLELSDIDVCKTDGTATDLSGGAKNVGFCPYYSKALYGNASVAVTNFYENDAKTSVVYTVPLESGGKVIGVLRAKQDPSLLRKSLQVTSFGGKEQVYLLTANGQIALSSDETMPSQKSFLNMFKTDSDTLSSITQLIRQGRSVFFPDIMVQGVSSSLSYEGVPNYDDWGVAVYIPSNELVPLFTQKPSWIDIAFPFLWLAGIAAAIMLLIMALKEIGKNDRMEKLAYRDPVVGCLSIVGFRKKFSTYLQKYKNEHIAIVQIGIDSYDSIQKFFGAYETTRLLINMSNVIRIEIKKDDIFCKANMKYFFILIRYQNESELTDFIKHLDSRLMQCNSEQDKAVKYNLSFRYGIYCLSPDDSDVNLLMDHAKQAYKKSQDSGEQKYAFFREKNLKQVISRQEVLSGIQRALDEKEICIYFQPTFDLNTGCQAACEALVRWIHPQKGIIFPGQFINVLEQDGLMVKLDQYIMNSVCSQLKVWMSKGYRLMPISVNISKLNFYDSNFENNMVSVVENYGVPPNLIKLEIAEDVFSEHGDIASEVIRRMKKRGFLISMDNFGTGTTSMNTFYQVPLDELKIDRKFLIGAGKSSKGQETIHGIIEMTKSLSIKVVSDGVDNKEQASMLRKLGCAMLQGYVFCEPLPVHEYENYAYGPRAKNNRIDI